MNQTDRILPVIDDLTQPHWEAAKTGKLLIQRCRSCDMFQWYPRAHCTNCWSEDIQWVEAAGKGSIETFTVTYRHGVPGLPSPFIFAIVKLVEGVCLSANIIDADPGCIAVGQDVAVVFEKISENLTIPQFSPITTECSIDQA